MSARETAFQLLKEICIKKKYSNLVLRKELDRCDPNEKGFVTQVVYGTLQNYRLCRYQWECYVKRLPDEDVCVLLDMSVYQLLYMEKAPAYAIVNDMVNITKKHIHAKYGNLVNAVLHKVEKQQEREITGSPEEQLAIMTSHPAWLVHMWKAQYGYDTAEQICRSNMETKPNAARVNTWKISRDELLQQDPDFVEGRLSKDAVLYLGSSLVATSYYKEGFISIQDEASQMVAILLDPKPGEAILDVCSAPGTKSMHIAELMKNEGRIVCGDIHEHRVALILEGANRLEISIIDAMVMDATKLEEIGDELFDRVLCDVPCSGYGVLARKSDIKYHMDSDDMDTLIPLQQEILQTSSQHVKDGGILVYSTCTLNKKENEKQVEKFLKEHEEFELIDQKTIFPFTYHTDGFFLAKMKKLEADE